MATSKIHRNGQVWSLVSGATECVLGGHGQSVMAVAASSNGDLVASASLDSTVRVWGEDSTEKGEIVCVARLCQDDGDPAYAVSFSPDDATVIAAVGCVVKVWNFIANECVTLVGHTDVVRGLAVSYDAVVSCSADESLRIWGSLAQCIQRIKLDSWLS